MMNNPPTPLRRGTAEKKEYYWICEVCRQKGTNNSVWIWGENKTALCHKDYKKWLEIKGKHYETAVIEMFGSLEKF